MSILSQMQTDPLMQMGLGMLGQSGPTRAPVGFGAAFGAGMTQGLDNLQRGQQAQFQNQQMQFQGQQMQQQQAQQQAFQEQAPGMLAQMGVPQEQIPGIMALGPEQVMGMINQAHQDPTPSMLNAAAMGLIPGTPEYNAFISADNLPAAPTPSNLQSKSGILQGEDRVTSFNFNPDTGVYSRMNAQGVLEEFPGSMITPATLQGSGDDLIGANKRDDLIAQRQSLQYQSEQLTSLIGSATDDPTSVGAAGMIRRNVQLATGTFTDLSQLFSELGAQKAVNQIADVQQRAAADADITRDQWNDLFNNRSLSEISLYENTLAYTLARLRTDDGRLTQAIIDDAKEDAKITGFTGSNDVIYRMEAINDQMQRKIMDLDVRINDGRQTYIPTMEELREKYLPPGP